MKPHISLITLGVMDLKKSTEFYKKIGLPTETTGNITFIKMTGTWLSLYAVDELAKDAKVKNVKTGFSGFTLAHNVISKEQVNQVIEEAREIGAQITDEPRERDWGGYSGYFQDPDGYLWEVAFNPYSPEIAVDEED